MPKSPEVEKNHPYRLMSGFYNQFLNGSGLDIDHHTEFRNFDAVHPTARKFVLNDENKLPFGTKSFDYIFSSHCLEHVQNYKKHIQEMYRIAKLNGKIIIIVPHQYLYEKKLDLPSQWNLGHHRFYTADSLLKEISESLEINSYRIIYLRENDDNFDYKIPANVHSNGSFEIECVLQKIKKPPWEIK